MNGSWMRPGACETGSCVEVQDLGSYGVWIRNSGDLGKTIHFTGEEWDAFMVALGPDGSWQEAPVQ